MSRQKYPNFELSSDASAKRRKIFIITTATWSRPRVAATDLTCAPQSRPRVAATALTCAPQSRPRVAATALTCAPQSRPRVAATALTCAPQSSVSSTNTISNLYHHATMRFTILVIAAASVTSSAAVAVTTKPGLVKPSHREELPQRATITPSIPLPLRRSNSRVLHTSTKREAERLPLNRHEAEGVFESNFRARRRRTHHGSQEQGEIQNHPPQKKDYSHLEPPRALPSRLDVPQYTAEKNLRKSQSVLLSRSVDATAPSPEASYSKNKLDFDDWYGSYENGFDNSIANGERGHISWTDSDDYDNTDDEAAEAKSKASSQSEPFSKMIDRPIQKGTRDKKYLKRLLSSIDPPTESTLQNKPDSIFLPAGKHKNNVMYSSLIDMINVAENLRTKRPSAPYDDYSDEGKDEDIDLSDHDLLNEDEEETNQATKRNGEHPQVARVQDRGLSDEPEAAEDDDWALPRMGPWDPADTPVATAVLGSIMLFLILVVVVLALRVHCRNRSKQAQEWIRHPMVTPAAPASGTVQPLLHHPQQEPIRIKAKGLLERRGSNTSLTLELGPDSLDSLVPSRECTPEDFLLTAGNRLSRRALRESFRDPRLLHAEFWDIPTNHPDRCAVPGSAAKNRYRTVLPNEDTRVVLKTTKGEPHPTDHYINANYIRGYDDTNFCFDIISSGYDDANFCFDTISSGYDDANFCFDTISSGYDKANGYDGEEKAYIATQGPLAHTTSDLWLMVLQERARAVVMITRLKEKGRVKCEPYVPAYSAQYGDLTITVKQVIEKNGYSIRQIHLKRGEDTHTTLHFWFTSWPDHKTPSSARHLLNMAAEVHATVKESEGLVVVHCSAGIGRTGCFIAISIGVQQLLEEGAVDVLATVCQMRLDSDPFLPASKFRVPSKPVCVTNGVAENKLANGTSIQNDDPASSSTDFSDGEVTVKDESTAATCCSEPGSSSVITKHCRAKSPRVNECAIGKMNVHTHAPDTSQRGSCSSGNFNFSSNKRSSTSSCEHLNQSYNFYNASSSRNSVASESLGVSGGGPLDWLRNTFGSSSASCPNTGASNSPSNSCSSSVNMNGNLDSSSGGRNSCDRLSPPESKRQRTLLEKTCAIWEGFEPLKTSRQLTVSE
ncbi:PTP type protein phosphatase [Trinorchestia longiramus]|nr:PTP type protein phosphatase [Trinorchestia longiramus]